MLVKLAFVMQRLKKYLKKFLSWSTKIGEGGGQFLDFMGDTAVMRGDIELMGVPQSPTWETLGSKVSPIWGDITVIELYHKLKVLLLLLILL